ncbi:hypothetical protein M878_20270 [Streptomyces roseochromogenus subsp. oscitans DS 12.976]|uniref:Uncharacterized protein n=1 Tax=Streptomyces roseochromogenus subsp. oscitans DS 12.976 TaxID=1352936 RepID=V6KCB7_STRRC|nr:hypothetical protein M878_20270 [Streptomyces roseochromogenus subsp. oscitans DS 12.976]
MFVALLPVVVPALGGLSPVLFTFYGAAFHVRAEEMDVAEVWQFLASVYVLGISAALTLVLLACWGYVGPLFCHRTLRLLLPIAASTSLCHSDRPPGRTAALRASIGPQAGVRHVRRGRW